MHAPDTHPVEALFDKVLGSYERRPGPEDLARLTGELLAAGADVLIAAEPLRATDPRVVGAVRDWHKLTADGPNGDSPFGPWDYARGLARVIRTLHRQVEISRQPVAHRADPMFFSFGRMPGSTPRPAAGSAATATSGSSGPRKETVHDSMSGARPSTWAHEDPRVCRDGEVE